MPKRLLLTALALVIGVTTSAQGPRRVALGDWPEMRGPARDGLSRETKLIDKWTLNGENFLWRAPYGGRSAPIVMGNRVYVQNPAGRGTELQERVMALDADTGKMVWEYRFNLFQSDVPAHRVGWASPAADPETGNIYALSGGAQVIALSRDGKPLWNRSLGEEFAAFTTHGGRTMSPLVDGDLVIVSAAVSNWGGNAARAHRFIALDKRSGEIVYVANPGGRPYDTAYAAPFIASINGMRLLIAGLGDGGIHAVKAQTGERVWSYVAAKRAINTGVVVKDNTVFVSHGDENLTGTELGLIAALDGSQTGDVKATKWAVRGTEFGFSSPLVDGNRLYQIDGGSTLRTYDVETGRELWTQRLGAAQKAPPVLADGKIYVGTDGGAFFIVRPLADRAEVLSEVELPNSMNSCCGSEGTPEQILGGAAISRGRIFFVSSDAVYAIGSKQPTALSGFAVDEIVAPAPAGAGAPAYLQVVPTELNLAPGQSVRLRARLFDDKGRFLREDTSAAWSLDGLKGTVANGTFTVANDPIDQAGLIKATVGELTGQARARVARPLPWKETFDAYADGSAPPGWAIVTGSQVAVATLDGQKVLQKAPTDTIFKRARVFIGPTNLSDYTFEADVRAAERRRQMGDVGITAQRYSLVLYGTSQKLKLEPWEPETARTVTVPFSWKPDTWYKLKLRVENLANGQVRAQGKAWAAGEPEPTAWMIDKTDPIGNREGAPGLFIDAQYGVHLDNFALTPNQATANR
ncbi:MAG TPA: PQQ-binding-like beta-propeller repeat protein [Vicinamibacterales bacterium]|nr:PQQ-binding-like beta-propeller repeat protein [Vicinamibacterales bacterium]